MGPPCSIDAILTFNSKNVDGHWIPTRVGVGSWVMLQPGKHGGHAKDAKKHKAEGGYKVRIVKFKVKKGSSVVGEVKVQHAYMQRQLDLEPSVKNGGSNYLYLSHYYDWVDPKTIMDVLYVQHADVGEPQRGHHTHKQLLKMGVYFYNSLYIPRRPPSLFGRLEMIPLPTLEDHDWPIPDMISTKSYRSRLHYDFLSSMRPGTASRSTHIKWFMPPHVMVDLFSGATVHRTPLLFVFKNLTQASFDSVLDEGWDSKTCVGQDVIKCVVDRSSVIFRYHLGKSTLYANFVYNRHRLVGSTWEALEQAQTNIMVRILCQIPNREELLELEVGSGWTLANIRQKIYIALGDDDVEEHAADWKMRITNGGQIQEKVSSRHEQNRTAADIMPPKILQLGPK